MIPPKGFGASILLVLFLSACTGLPDAENLQATALEHVRSSSDYVDNGGFNETVIDMRIGDELSVVVVEYWTRHVGMLQMIGHYLCWVAIDPTTMDVIGTETQAQYDGLVDPSEPPVEPGDAGTSIGQEEPMNWTAADPDETNVTTVSSDDLQQKISYAINATLELIREYGAEENLSEALGLLDQAIESLSTGDYEAAYDLSRRAAQIVNEYIWGQSGSTGSDPGTGVPEPGVDMPWMYGYIVVFDHAPGDEDRVALQTMFNATLEGEAVGYSGEDHAYWVSVTGIPPGDLKDLEGVKEVYALRAEPDGTIGDGEGQSAVGNPETDVPETFLLALAVGALGAAFRKTR
jgi:hypothetical protein